MLVLDRGFGEEIIIGNDIKVIIIHIKRGKVRLGISAPKEISVHRTEIYEKIQNEKKQAEIYELVKQRKKIGKC